MKNIGLIFSKVIHKIKFNFKNILIVYVIIFFLWNLPTFISKLNINKAYVLLNTIGFVLIAVFCVCIIILIIFKMSDKIAYFIKQIKIYGISFKPYKSYLYSDINTYPEVTCFKIAGLSRFNALTITDKFLDTGINIVNTIKTYIPEANDKTLSNILSYINKNYTKRINKDNTSIMLDIGTEQGRIHVKFENKNTTLFLTISQVYGYGNIERTYETQQVYELITNNNELLHAVKELNLSSIFLYEVPLPWQPEYIEIKDEDSDELYKLKYDTIEEVFSKIDNTDYESWKEYVLNFFNEFDKLSDEKAKEFLKLTDYEVPEYWKEILLNKKYIEYLKKYINYR